MAYNNKDWKLIGAEPVLSLMLHFELEKNREWDVDVKNRLFMAFQQVNNAGGEKEFVLK